MGNSQFLRMKAGSEQLNAMMMDIRWCLSTVLGAVNKACEDFDSLADLLEQKWHQKLYRECYIQMGAKTKEGLYIQIWDGKRVLDPNQQWDPRTVMSVHENLDAVIDTGLGFCRQLGRLTRYMQFLDQLLLPTTA